MKCLLCISLLFFSSHVKAQDSAKYALKAYLNYSWENKVESHQLAGYSSIPQKEDVNNHFLKRPTPAIVFFREDGFHEFELVESYINKLKTTTQYTPNGNDYFTNTTTYYNTFLVARYEFSFRIFKKRQRKFTPHLGLAVMPRYRSSKITRINTVDVFYRVRQLGITFSVVPRVTMNLGKRFFIDLNTPIDYLNINVNFTKDQGYFFDTGYKTFDVVEQRGFPNIINARLGFGVKF